jgi:transcriptional regulator with XRE-family HTH domain
MKKQAFGAYLKDLRLARGYGLRAFAKKVDLLPSNLSNIETGKASPPRSIDILNKIADGLGLSDACNERATLFDLAAKIGQVPVDVQEYLSKIDAMEELPLMARTIKNEKLTKAQIQQLIRDLKKP